MSKMLHVRSVKQQLKAEQLIETGLMLFGSEIKTTGSLKHLREPVV